MRTIQDLIDSLIIEREELEKKINKLEKFLLNADPDNVSFNQHYLLNLQHLAMLQYSDILNVRIKDFMYCLDLNKKIHVDFTEIKNDIK